MLRIERKEMLETQDGVGEQQPGQAEEDEGQGVLPPVLLDFRVDSQDPVKPSLDGSDGPVQPSFPLRLQNPDEIGVPEVS